MNNFSAVGRVGRDAVTRFTQGGKPVTGWALAIDTGFGVNKTTTWLDCTLWGERGQRLEEFIKKGDRLGVVGEIGTREHEGKTYVTLNVQNVTLLGEKKEGTGSAGSGGRKGGQEQRQRPAPATDSVEDELGDSDIPFVSQRGNW